MTMFATPSSAYATFKTPSVFRTIAAAFSAQSQRKALKSLDDARLRDLGLTYAQALQEAKRPVWDVPNHWLR